MIEHSAWQVDRSETAFHMQKPQLPAVWQQDRLRCICLVLLTSVLAVTGCSRGPATPNDGSEVTQQQATIGHEAWLLQPAFSPDATTNQLKREGIEVAELIVKNFPESPAVLNAAARFWFNLGQSEKAESLWQRCLKRDPRFVDAYFGLGLSADDASEFATAAQMFRKVIELAPDEPRGPAYLAGVLAKDGKPEEVVSTLLANFRTHAPSVDGLEQLGLAYLQLKQYDKAKPVFETLIKAAPEERRGYYGLARVYAQLGDRQKAQEYATLFHDKKSDETERMFRYVRGFSDTASLRDILVRTLNEAGDAARQNNALTFAEEMWRKAAVLAPQDPRSRHNLVILYDQQHRDADGLMMCRQLCSIQPKNADYWLNAGLLHARLQQLDQARTAIQHALKLDPHDARYQRAYAALKGNK